MGDEDEDQLRRRIAAIPLEWVERARGRVEGDDRNQFVDLIAAAHVVDDEARRALPPTTDHGLLTTDCLLFKIFPRDRPSQRRSHKNLRRPASPAGGVPPDPSPAHD